MLSNYSSVAWTKQGGGQYRLYYSDWISHPTRAVSRPPVVVRHSRCDRQRSRSGVDRYRRNRGNHDNAQLGTARYKYLGSQKVSDYMKNEHASIRWVYLPHRTTSDCIRPHRTALALHQTASAHSTVSAALLIG